MSEVQKSRTIQQLESCHGNIPPFKLVLNSEHDPEMGKPYVFSHSGGHWITTTEVRGIKREPGKILFRTRNSVYEITNLQSRTKTKRRTI